MSDLTNFIEKWLFKVFGKDSFTLLFVVEKEHRTPTRAIPGNVPGPVLECLLNYKTHENTLHLAREKYNIQYNVVRVSFYPDISADVQCQRAKVADIKKLLHPQLKYPKLYTLPT